MLKVVELSARFYPYVIGTEVDVMQQRSFVKIFPFCPYLCYPPLLQKLLTATILSLSPLVPNIIFIAYGV